MTELNDQEPGEVALRVSGLSKQYEQTFAVQELSFEVRRGEILGLVGPNGAGKTTTLRSIAGVLPVQTGEVEIAGRNLLTEEAAAKAALSWVPDDPQPFDSLTVFEHMEFTAALYAMKDWRGRADALIEEFELAAKRDALGGELSRGMRQKLAYCCAWLPRPSVSLLDEPLSGLDPRGIRAARDAIREMALGGSAVILSSHQLELIELLADRILIISKGRKVFDGTLDEAREAMAGAGRSLEEIFMAITDGSSSPDSDPANEVGSSELTEREAE